MLVSRKSETNRMKVWRPLTWCVDSRQCNELGSGWSMWASRFNLQRSWKPRYKKTTQTPTTDISTSLPTTSLSVKLLHFGFKSWQSLELQLYFTSNRPVYISLLQMSNNDVSPLFISCSKSRQYRAFKVLLQRQNVAFYDIPLMWHAHYFQIQTTHSQNCI